MPVVWTEHLAQSLNELMENWISEKTNYFCIWLQQKENSQLKIKAPTETESNLILNGILEFLSHTPLESCYGHALYLCRGLSVKKFISFSCPTPVRAGAQGGFLWLNISIFRKYVKWEMITNYFASTVVTSSAVSERQSPYTEMCHMVL